MHMFVFLCLLISTLSLKYCYFPPPPIMSVTLHHCPKIPSFSCPLFFHHEQHFRVCFQFGVAFTSALTFLHSMSKLISIIFFYSFESFYLVPILSMSQQTAVFHFSSWLSIILIIIITPVFLYPAFGYLSYFQILTIENNVLNIYAYALRGFCTVFSTVQQFYQ